VCIQEWAKNPPCAHERTSFKKRVAKRDKNSTLGVVNPYNVMGVTNPCTKRGIKGQKRETKQDCNVAPSNACILQYNYVRFSGLLFYTYLPAEFLQ
jgi:hypothetical protein